MKRSQLKLQEIWLRTQQLPVGVREKILYPVPLKILGLLCRVGTASFCQSLGFWQGKLKYDGYFLSKDHEVWVEQHLDCYCSLAHFYSEFTQNKGPLDLELNVEQRYETEIFWGRCYQQMKRYKTIALPKILSKNKWKAQRDNLRKFIRESWDNWWRTQIVYLDLLFQKGINDLRKYNKQLVILVPFKIKQLPGNYPTLLSLFEDSSTEFYDIDCQDLLAVGLKDPNKESDSVTYNSHLFLILNRLHRLNDLLRTGDLFVHGDEASYLFVLRKEDQVLLFNMPQGGTSPRDLLFPPEAFTYISQNNDCDYLSYDYDYNWLMMDVPSPKLAGYTLPNKDGRFDIYLFPRHKTENQKSLVKSSKLIGNVIFDREPTFTCIFPIKGQRTPKFTDAEWFRQAEQLEDREEEDDF